MTRLGVPGRKGTVADHDPEALDRGLYVGICQVGTKSGGASSGHIVCYAPNDRPDPARSSPATPTADSSGLMGRPRAVRPNACTVCGRGYLPLKRVGKGAVDALVQEPQLLLHGLLPIVGHHCCQAV